MARLKGQDIFQVGGKFCEGDNGVYYKVLEVLQNGMALLESEYSGYRVFAQVTGRTIQYTSFGGQRVRIKFFEAIDIGKANFEKLSETLQPNLEETWGGWAWI